MYRVAATGGRSDGFRPWGTRLSGIRHRGLTGLGVYTPGEYVVPTTSDTVFQRTDYPFMDPELSFKPGTQSVSNIHSVQAAPQAKPRGVTGMGGLGIDLRGLTSSPLTLLAIGAGLYWYFVLRKK